MKETLIEEFSVPYGTIGFNSYKSTMDVRILQGKSFQNDPPNEFKVYVNGCGIGPFMKTLEEARKLAFEYVKVRIEDGIMNFDRARKVSESSLEKLGNDVFNLAYFKK